MYIYIILLYIYLHMYMEMQESVDFIIYIPRVYGGSEWVSECVN
jgi:hypothetical protein